MASAEGGDRSNLTSSDSGQTARFGGGSHIGDDSFAMPVATGDAEVELPAIEDADDSHVFADSCMIAENVMASLTSSMTASHVPGLTGSSESRKKSRSPPREIMDRPGRSQHGTPPSRGTARSGASPANTPSRTAAVVNDAFSVANDQTVLFTFYSLRSLWWIGINSSRASLCADGRFHAKDPNEGLL